MFKKTHLQSLGIFLGGLVLLTACTAEKEINQNSEQVLQNMLTQASKVHEAKTEMELNVKMKEGQSSNVSLEIQEKTNAQEIQAIQSKNELTLTGDLTLLTPVYEEGTEKATPKLQQITVDAAAEVQVIGRELYASLSQLDLGGDFQGLKEAKALLPLTVGPYMNKVLYLPLERLEALVLETQGKSPEKADIERFKTYFSKQAYQDLADSKLLVVLQDHGLEKVKKLGGKKVKAYHYELGLDSEGLKTFLTKLNAALELQPQEEWEAQLSKQDPSLAEVVEVLNQAFTLELWIGQEDYHPYQTKMSSDLKQLKAATDKLAKMDEKFVLNPSVQAFFETGTFNFNWLTQSRPINAFSLKKPAEEEVMNLTPMLELLLQGASNPGPLPQTEEGGPVGENLELESSSEAAAE